MFFCSIQVLQTADGKSKRLLLAVVLCGGLYNLADAQVLAPAPIFDDRSRQNIDRLRQNDLMLRSEISGQRVDRQVEIGRLEGRIDRIEKQLRDLPNEAGTSQFALVLTLLNEAEQREAAVDPQLDSPPSDLPPPDSPPSELPQPAEDRAARIASRQKQLLEWVARDYSLALEIEAVEARVSLLEAAAELSSLERLSAKGLASSGQVKFQSLKHQKAELQLRRIDQQLAGMRELYPQYFAEELPSDTGTTSTERRSVKGDPVHSNAVESVKVDNNPAGKR